MIIIDKLTAIVSLVPGANTVCYEDGTIEWLDTNTALQPTDAEIATEVTRLQAEYDNAQYQRDRATAYPSLADQADMQYHDSVNGTTTWVDAILAVKAEFPKPE